MNTVDKPRPILKALFLAFLILPLTVSATLAEPLKALVVKGKVYVRAPGKDKFSTLKKGDEVVSKSIIKTEENSLALLKNSTMTTKVIQRSMIKITISKSGKAAATIGNGGALFRYLKGPKSSKRAGLKIKTKTASLGVRGTTFMVYSGEKNNSILSVKEGSVDFRGKSSLSDINVGAGNSTMTNQQNKNLKPRDFGLQEKINWALKKDEPLEQPKEFFSAAEKMWQQYKKEQEFIWKSYKNEQEQKWKNFINN